jgi:hypothetical protein
MSCDPHPVNDFDILETFSMKDINNQFNKIGKHFKTKTNSQCQNLIDLRDYQENHPVKGFFKETYYHLTGKI